MTIERLRELLADEDTFGPWRPEGLAEDELPAAPVWLENDAGDLWRISVTAVAMAMSALPALLDVVEAAREVCDPMVADGGGDRWWGAHDRLAHALDALDKLAIAP